MIQRLRICPPMRGVQVQPLVWGEPPCCEAEELACHSHSSPRSSLCSAAGEATVVRSPHTTTAGSLQAARGPRAAGRKTNKIKDQKDS